MGKKKAKKKSKANTCWEGREPEAELGCVVITLKVQYEGGKPVDKCRAQAHCHHEAHSLSKEFSGTFPLCVRETKIGSWIVVQGTDDGQRPFRHTYLFDKGFRKDTERVLTLKLCDCPEPEPNLKE